MTLVRVPWRGTRFCPSCGRKVRILEHDGRLIFEGHSKVVSRYPKWDYSRCAESRQIIPEDRPMDHV